MSTECQSVHVKSIDSADGKQGVVCELGGSESVARRLWETSTGDEDAMMSELTDMNKTNQLVARYWQLLNTTTDYLQPRVQQTVLIHDKNNHA